MSDLAKLREQVSQRAKYACEFCGASELSLVQFAEQANQQLLAQIEKQQKLLKEQRDLINRLLH